MKTHTDDDPVFTRHESAAYSGVHVVTLDRARKAGELRAIVRGRIIRHRRSHLDAWLSSHEVGGHA